jgi:type IV secretion system protein TrbG
MMKIMGKRKWKYTLIAIVMACSVSSHIGLAAAADDTDYTSLIQNQQQILESLKDKKDKQETINHITSLDQQVSDLKKQLTSFDAQEAISSLSAQINSIQDQLSKQADTENQLTEALKNLKTLQMQPSSTDNSGDFYGTAATTKYLVNPGPSPTVGYTQDAINAQGDSTMMFAYAPSQLYKIYCKVGYLTDLQFKKGETIEYVGGGETAKWAIDRATVDGVPHLYIKPINPNSTTNIIVNTSKHSYQIIVNASDWYNPMVSWSYSAEENFAAAQQQKKDERIYTGTLNVSNPDQLNFAYEIKGDADWKPSRVFDDGQTTYVQFDHMTNKLPMLYIREPHKKGISLVNYKVKNKYYIIEKIFDQAELRLGDEKITIKSVKAD